jgi:hypothetical protein
MHQEQTWQVLAESSLQQTCSISRAKKSLVSLSWNVEVLQFYRFIQNKRYDQKLKVIATMLTHTCQFVTCELKEKKKYVMTHGGGHERA